MVERKTHKIEIKKNELYREIDLIMAGEKIGEAEIEVNGKMLSRLTIYPPYQNKGYGTEAVKVLNDEYGLDCLWVEADNKRAIHVYEKNGYRIDKPTVFLMTRVPKPEEGISKTETTTGRRKEEEDEEKRQDEH